MSAAGQERSRSEYVRHVLIAVAIVALAFLVWKLAYVGILLFAGVLFAIILHALADPLARRCPVSYRWSLVIVGVASVGLLGLVGWFIGDRIASQTGELTTRLPEAYEKARAWLSQTPFGDALRSTLNETTSSATSMRRLASVATTTLGALTNSLLVIFVGIFLASNPDLYRRGVLALIPRDARPRTESALNAVGHALKRWLLGQMLSMVLVGLLTGIGLWALGVPLALSLGVLAGLLEFVPFIGPIVAAIPGVLIAFTVSPQTALYATLLYFLIQQIEGNAILPLAQRWAVALPPALALTAVLACWILFGIMGVLLATPLTVAVMVLVQKLYVDPLNGAGSHPSTLKER